MSEERKPKPSRPRRQVGYRNPPQDTRWKAGEPSPNPRGRPKKNKPPRLMPAGPDPYLHLAVLEEGNRLIAVHENGVREEIPLVIGIVRHLAHSAAKGDVRAQLKFIDLYQEGERQRLKDVLSLAETLLEHQRAWAERFAEYDHAGLERPVVVPHPDDIQIDASTGAVRINGPRDLGEKTRWDNGQVARAEAEETLRRLRRELKQHPEDHERIQAEIQKEQDMVALVDTAYPSEAIRRVAGFDLAAWQRQRRRQR